MRKLCLYDNPQGSQRGELKYLSTLRKRNQRDSVSSASETGTAQTYSGNSIGVVGPRYETEIDSRTQLGSWIKEGDNPVDEIETSPSGILSITGHLKSCENLGRPWSKAKYYLLTDSELVP